MSEHTPGPWTYEFVPEDDERDLPHSEWSGLYIGPEDETGRVLNTIFEGGITHSSKDGNPEADARLIAAAPDLLAALQRAEQYLVIAIIDGREREPKLNKETLAIAERDLEMLQAAITKAKGQPQ